MTEDHDEGVVHRIFRRRAAERPDAVALVHRGDPTSYRALDELSDAFAAELAAAGVGAGAVVPLVMPRSPRLIATMLAVLKLGAAYAALDPRWPRARIEELAGLAGAPLLATSPDRADGWSLKTWTPVGGQGTAAVPPASPPVRETDTCCVFFTSGSTGQPKGVCSPHSGIVRLCTPSPSVHIGPGAVVPQAAPLPWDAMSLELWPALLNGGTSVLVDEPYLTTGGLRALVRDHGVNTVWLTASLFNLFVEEDPDCFTGVHQVLTGGERLSPPHVREFLVAHPHIELWNGYGPVESTVFATTHRITPSDCATDDGIPVGTPVPRTGVLVVDERLRPCPAGTTGEICVTGAGLANGYLANPQQTREHFVEITVRGTATRAYRTGDLGHLSAAGVLHHAGRIDRQLKVRGHRVEPGEVEARVIGIAGVRGCAVLPVRRGGPGYAGLVAAVTLTSTATVTVDDIGDVLRAALPPYLVPESIRAVPEFPLTANGKLDTAALLEAITEPDGHVTRATGPPAAVDSTVRGRVAAAFGEVLGRAAIPPGVSFFELGGDSLDGARLCARIGTAVGIAVPASVLIRWPTVDGLVTWLGSRAEPTTGIPVPAADGRHRLLPVQAGFLFAHLTDRADVSAHCELHWRVRGNFDAAAFTAAVGEVHRRNQSLHARYAFDREPVALVDRPPPPPEVRRLDPAPDWETAAAFAHDVLGEPLDIGAGRVWRCAVIPVADGSGWLISVVVHHIAFDGASARPLADQLGAAYRAESQAVLGRPGTLAEVFAGYRAQTDEASLDEQRAYWRARLQGVPPLTPPVPPDRSAAGAAQGFRLAPATLAAVDRAAHRWGSTRFAVLLAAYAEALASVGHQRDFAIGAPIAKRYHPDTADAIGCLIDVVCFRFTPRGDATTAAVPASLPHVHAGLAAQDVPFEEVVRLAADPVRDRLRHPLFQTMFALQNGSTAVLDLDGCQVSPVPPRTGRAVHELEVEVWPEPGGAAHVVVGHQPERVAAAFARDVTAAYRDLLERLGHLRGDAGGEP